MALIFINHQGCTMKYVSTENSPIKEVIDFFIGPLVVFGMAYPSAIKPLLSLFETVGKISHYSSPYVLFEACSNGLNNGYKAIEEMNADGSKFVLY